MEPILPKMLIALGILVVGWHFARRLMPEAINPLTRIIRRLLGNTARFLWAKRERQGPARSEPPQFRYRE